MITMVLGLVIGLFALLALLGSLNVSAGNSRDLIKEPPQGTPKNVHELRIELGYPRETSRLSEILDVFRQAVDEHIRACRLQRRAHSEYRMAGDGNQGSVEAERLGEEALIAYQKALDKYKVVRKLCREKRKYKRVLKTKAFRTNYKLVKQACDV